MAAVKTILFLSIQSSTTAMNARKRKDILFRSIFLRKPRDQKQTRNKRQSSVKIHRYYVQRSWTRQWSYSFVTQFSSDPIDYSFA